MTLRTKLDEHFRRREQGNWVPASGGKEEPFRTRTGRRLQYLWQPSTGKHAYYDVDSDLILSDEDAMHALGHYHTQNPGRKETHSPKRSKARGSR